MKVSALEIALLIILNSCSLVSGRSSISNIDFVPVSAPTTTTVNTPPSPSIQPNIESDGNGEGLLSVLVPGDNIVNVPPITISTNNPTASPTPPPPPKETATISVTNNDISNTNDNDSKPIYDIFQSIGVWPFEIQFVFRPDPYVHVLSSASESLANVNMETEAITIMIQRFMKYIETELNVLWLPAVKDGYKLEHETTIYSTSWSDREVDGEDSRKDVDDTITSSSTIKKVLHIRLSKAAHITLNTRDVDPKSYPYDVPTTELAAAFSLALQSLITRSTHSHLSKVYEEFQYLEKVDFGGFVTHEGAILSVEYGVSDAEDEQSKPTSMTIQALLLDEVTIFFGGVLVAFILCGAAFYGKDYFEHAWPSRRKNQHHTIEIDRERRSSVLKNPISKENNRQKFKAKQSPTPKKSKAFFQNDVYERDTPTGNCTNKSAVEVCINPVVFPDALCGACLPDTKSVEEDDMTINIEDISIIGKSAATRSIAGSTVRSTHTPTNDGTVLFTPNSSRPKRVPNPMKGRGRNESSFSNCFQC